ncbi:uncharacterized protein G2W53_014925 [Senna tora]|uniref:Uncharacterized protein n=1 Tax=Senna tora TaxID=362788 RepID=A0A835C8Y2_9FABA|nr:uncharacterized protein G2W53_014925 [Senna tora]
MSESAYMCNIIRYTIGPLDVSEIKTPDIFIMLENKDVTEAIQKVVAAAYDCKIIEGHGVSLGCAIARYEFSFLFTFTLYPVWLGLDIH